MEDLRLKLDLIREGHILTNEAFQLEVDTCCIRDAFLEVTFIHSMDSLIESDDASFITRAKARIKQIIEAIIKAVRELIQRIKKMILNIRKKNSRDTVLSGTTSDNVSVRVPEKLFEMDARGYIEACKKLNETVNDLAENAESYIAHASEHDLSSNTIFRNLLGKVVHLPDSMDSMDIKDFELLILGQYKAIKLNKIDKRRLISEIDKTADGADELNNISILIGENIQKHNRYMDCLFKDNPDCTEETIKAAKYIYKLYDQLSIIITKLLGVYGKRYSLLIKLMNLMEEDISNNDKNGG